MKIAVLAAMDKEVQLLISILDNAETAHVDGISIYKGVIGTHSVVITRCGIGKVNAALNTLKVIRYFSPDLVINSGVAGGAGVPIGSVLVADKVAYDDVWCGPGTEFGHADGFPLFMLPSEKVIQATEKFKAPDMLKGLICTGDMFISTADEIAFIRSKFSEVKAVDMESAAIAQTCIDANVEFGIVRVVSDTPGEGENIEQYRNFWTRAPQKTFDTVRHIILSLD